MTQLSRLKQENWKESYIPFLLTVSILYESSFLVFFLWFTAHHHLTQQRPSVCPSVCLSVRQAMCWCLDMCVLMHTSDVRPAKDLVMGLSAHDQTFAFRVILTVIIWPYRFEKTSWGWAVPSWFLLDSLLLWCGSVCLSGNALMVRHKAVQNTFNCAIPIFWSIMKKLWIFPNFRFFSNLSWAP